MSAARDDENAREASPVASHAPASGVVRKDELDAELAGDAPPWSATRAYLARGEHAAWIEAHAARSRAFAEVLAALQNDDDERAEGASVRRPRR
jgi:hypothetical protein